jgi:hypothetical protein
MNKLFVVALLPLAGFSYDYAVLPVSADITFNYFFSIFAIWGIILSGFFAALSLLRL